MMVAMGAAGRHEASIWYQARGRGAGKKHLVPFHSLQSCILEANTFFFWSAMSLCGQVLSCSHLPLPLAWAARNRLQPFKLINYLPRETGLGKSLYLKVWGLKWELRFCHHGNPLKAMAFSERGPSVWSPPWSGWELQLCVGSFAFMSTARTVSGLFSLSTEDLY